jgi:endonuclease/exonuclease/phosphatase family metal-dependent hydrolase
LEKISMAENKQGMIDSRLKVLTWNIWWRFGPWESRGPAILETLNELDADLIALQEVWGDGVNNFAAELAAELDYQCVFHSSMQVNGSEFGNAILSRWPIEISKATMLHGKNETGEGRLGLYANIAGPRGVVPIISTHLNWRFEQSHVRQRQVMDLAKFIDSKRPWSFPPILCGDFNAEPDSDEIRMLKGLTTCPVEGLVFHDAWGVAGKHGLGITWDNSNPYTTASFEPDRRLDYIFVGLPESSGAGQIVDCRVTGNQPVNGILPSDHYGVLAELRY